MNRLLNSVTGGLVLVIGAGLSGCMTFEELTTPPPRPAPIRSAQPTEHQNAALAEAQAAIKRGDYDAALEAFHGILAENPTIAPAYVGIGDIYLEKEDYARAEPAYGRAARLEPRNFEAQYGHGVALQMLNRFVEAIKAYSRALTISPNDPDANKNLATTYLQSGDARRAVAYAERAVALNPDSGPARASLGSIYDDLGRYGDAVDAYLGALEIMGNKAPLMINLIKVLGKEKRFREAANTAQTLVRIDPSANAYERLGWCHFKLREYDRSTDAYKAAVQIDPHHWPSLNGIGVNALNRWLLSKKEDSQARLEASDAFRRSLRANDNQDRVISLMLKYGL